MTDCARSKIQRMPNLPSLAFCSESDKKTKLGELAIGWDFGPAKSANSTRRFLYLPRLARLATARRGLQNLLATTCYGLPCLAVGLAVGHAVACRGACTARCGRTIGHLTVGYSTVTGVPLFLFAFHVSSLKINNKAEGR